MKKHFLLFSLLISLILTACQRPADSSVSKNVSPTFEPGQANITGIIVSIKDSQPVTNTAVHLAEVHRQGNEGAFLMDASNSPSTMTDNEGILTFTGIPTGEYVIVVGDMMRNYSIVAGPDGKAAIYAAYVDQTVDVGTLKTDYQP